MTPARRSWRLLAALCALPGLSPPLLAGQTPGATVEAPYTVTFSTGGQSMWGPADAPADIDVTFILFDEGWGSTGSDSDIQNLAGTQWGGSISGTTSGEVGMHIRFFDIGTGAVDVNYPVRIVLDLPEPNSFRGGQQIEIASRFELLPGWSFTTAPPGGSVQLGGKFGTSIGATGKVCFFGCSGTLTLVPGPTIPTEPFDLFVIESRGLLSFPTPFPPPLPNPLEIRTLPYEFGAAFEPFGDLLGLSGPVDAPHVETSAALKADGRSLRAAGSHRFVDLSIDLDSYLVWTGVPPLGFQSNPALELVSGASFGYDIAALDLPLGISQQQVFEFAPTVTATLDLPVAMPWEVVDGGAVVAQGEGSSVAFEVGQSVRLGFPANRTTPLASTPAFGLDNTFTSRTDYVFDEEVVVSAGRFELHTPDESIVDQTTRRVCSLGGGIALTICEIIGGFIRTITNTVTTNIPAIDVDLGPLAQETLVDEVQTTPFFPFSGRSGQWELQGFGEHAGAPFELDPENPIIAVATSMAPSLLGGGPAGSITQTVVLTNAGDVPLALSRLDDAVAALLAASPFDVLSVSSPVLATDPTFDGTTVPALLTPGQNLGVGGEAWIDIVLGVGVGDVYRAAVDAGATSPIGTAVSDEAAAAIGRVAFEITPDRVSEWSNGVLPVRVHSQGIEVAGVDAASLRLEGVTPEQTNLTNSGTLVLKFPLPDVLAALDARLSALLVATDAPVAAGLRAAPPAGDVAAWLLGETDRLDASARDAVDRIGNANGALDVGDLRALVRLGSGTGGILPVAASGSAESTDAVLLLTGALLDGTPIFGEDDLSVLQGGN